MKTIPFVHEGLGNSSYVVDLGNGAALVFDPDRSVARYLDALDANGLAVAGIFETHLHADFVSGARELASRTGAPPIFVPAAGDSKFPHVSVEAGRALSVAGAEVEAVGSPGHTPEHLSYAVRSAAGPASLFSGGSLIVGGAARTDLLSPALTDSLTRAQFRTLRQAFARFPDETLLYPTHGGGSFCSTGAGVERASTLGRERRENPLLAFDDEQTFVDWFPATFPAVPAYFYRLRAVNQAGPRLHGEIDGPAELSAGEFAARAASSVVVDGRSKEAYARGHIPGSLSNPYRGDFPVWLGWLVPEDASLLFVADRPTVAGMTEEALLVGYERFGGWLEGGVDAWTASGRGLAQTELIDAARARGYLLEGAVALDVREPAEYEAAHIPGAVHIPLGSLPERVGEVPSDRPAVVYCGHGPRASTAVSLLEAAGHTRLANLNGGIGAWRTAGYSVE